jgi:hypothetical protein
LTVHWLWLQKKTAPPLVHTRHPSTSPSPGNFLGGNYFGGWKWFFFSNTQEICVSLYFAKEKGEQVPQNKKKAHIQAHTNTRQHTPHGSGQEAT